MEKNMEATIVFRRPRTRQVSSVSKGLVCFACFRVYLGWQEIHKTLNSRVFNSRPHANTRAIWH